MRAKSLALILLLALPTVFGGAPVVYADEETCTGTLSGEIDGNVVVRGGDSCTLSDATVKGSVRVSQNARLTIDATEQPTTIHGNIEADGCASAFLKGGVSVGGNVEIQQCAQRSGFHGPGVEIHGNFHCTGDHSGCEAALGAVGGNVLIQNNGPSSDISLVSVGGNLVCQSNAPAPTHLYGPDFVKGNLSGQCAATLGFAPSGAAPNCVASALNVPNVTIQSATVVAANSTTPQYCQIMGTLVTDGEGFGPGSALFRLKLPLAWNNLYVFEGCGATCGSVTSTSVNPVDDAEALGLGYAVVNTDTGHEQAPNTRVLTWAVSPTGVVNFPGIIDYYYRAVHQVTVATKQYVQAYYSKPIDYAYFDGCSNGGRQTMMEGTRYPVDYQGLIVGDPNMASDYWRASQFKQAKAFIPNGTYIPAAKLAQVDAAVKASCDAIDGVADGLIQNPAACSFNIMSLVPGVLTATQAAGLQAYVTRLNDEFGRPVFPGMTISDISTNGFITADENNAPPTDPSAAEPWGTLDLGPDMWGSVDAGIKAFIEYNQAFDVNNNWPETITAAGNFIPDSALALLRQRAGSGNTDDPRKLTNFLKKGAKVIMYHGGSDPRISHFRTTWYYEQLALLHGGYSRTQDSVRLYIVPGMGHCGGGVSPNRFETLQLLHNWVTKGTAPDQIVATATNGRTMPLCKFPEAARYLGSGDVNVAANWTCDPNDTRMLQIGLTGLAAGADTATAMQYFREPIGLGAQDDHHKPGDHDDHHDGSGDRGGSGSGGPGR
jgi:feruloyl esterase